MTKLAERGWILAAAAAAVALAPAGGARAATPEVVARVGVTDVDAGEIRAYLDSLGPQERAAAAGNPAVLAQVVRTYLASRAVLGEALAARWDQQAAVKAKLERIREQALVELFLESVSRPPAGFPAETQVRAAYDANKESFLAPRKLRVAQVFVAAPRGVTGGEEKARARLDEVVRKLKQKGSDFAAIARAESDAKDEAERGGEIGWVAEGELAPGIRTTVAALARDAVSEPVRLDDGWHVVKLLDVKPAGTRPFEEVREAIAAELIAQRSKALRQEYLARLLQRTPPAINELALSRVLAKPN